MKVKVKLISFVFFIISFVSAGDVEDIKKQIFENNRYANEKNISASEYSKYGALEFWSSGGLMHEIPAKGRPEIYDYMNIKYKNLEVIILEPKKAAVVMYYSEGSMKPKNAPAVNHYLTRVTQALVKESGEWKVRASHWSPIMGGSGTSQASTE